MDNNMELQHHGILGQKWGVRRYQNEDGSLTAAGKKKNKYNRQYSQADRSIDKTMYGKGGVKRINRRMNKGMSHTKAEAIEFGQQFVKGSLISIGTVDVISGGLLHKAVGKAAVDKYMKSKAAKSIIKIAQNRKFDPIDVAYKVIN